MSLADQDCNTEHIKYISPFLKPQRRGFIPARRDVGLREDLDYHDFVHEGQEEPLDALEVSVGSILLLVNSNSSKNLIPLFCKNAQAMGKASGIEPILLEVRHAEEGAGRVRHRAGEEEVGPGQAFLRDALPAG